MGYTQDVHKMYIKYISEITHNMYIYKLYIQIIYIYKLHVYISYTHTYIYI